ncbi:MAG: hypothetical protein IKH63_01250 [Prevotella sp.]|nr:hypothetical protein [Prevotella sp.]
MKKITKESLNELAKKMPVLSEKAQATFVGGGDGTFSSPYTFEEYSGLHSPTQVYYLDSEGVLSYDLSDVIIMGVSGSYLYDEGSGITITSGNVGVSGYIDNSSNNGSGNYFPWGSPFGEDYGDTSYWKWFFGEVESNNSANSEGNGNDGNSIWGWSTLGLGTVGDLGMNAGFILDDRGVYMPEGTIQSFTLKHPITVRLPIGGIETNSQILNVIRVGGNYFGILGDFVTAYDILNDFKSGNESTAWGKLAFTIAETGCAYIPGYGWAISLGLGIVEQFIFE